MPRRFEQIVFGFGEREDFEERQPKLAPEVGGFIAMSRNRAKGKLTEILRRAEVDMPFAVSGDVAYKNRSRTTRLLAGFHSVASQ